MELIAEKREKIGKQTKQLRRENLIPAVVFGPDTKSFNVSVPKTKFKKVFDETGETSLIDLKVGTATHKVLVKEVQVNPVSSALVHIGLYKPNLKVKINADIPVEIIREIENPLIKSGEAMALKLMDSLTIEALPTDLPSAFIIDVSKLEKIGDHVTIAQLEYDREKVEIVDLEPDTMVVKIDSAEMKEEEVAVEVTEEEALAGIEATKETAEDEEEDTEE